MKKILSISLILSCLLFLTQCKNEDDTIDTVSEGIFLDSPVEGLSYKSRDLIGSTNSDGKFEYRKNQTIIFSIGGIIIGEAEGKDIITPLDLVENGSVNDPIVRNIASFLQSLDEDNDPTNGILINNQTKEALSNETLDFNSGSFLISLTELVNKINIENSSSLVAVYSNDAAHHLAENLNLLGEFKFLPRTLQGRQWEIGTYLHYYITHIDEYYIRIENNDLTNVRLNFGNNRGYYMDMHYEQNRLNSIGNYYTDLNSNPPTTTSYLYNNRTASTGFVFDYGEDTYLGGFNLYKTQGEIGSLQGVYRSLLFREKQYQGSDEVVIHYQNDYEVTIGNKDENGDFPVAIKSFDIDQNIINEYSTLINSIDVNNENILLIQFQDTDHIFMKKNLFSETIYGFSASIGRYAIKE